MRDATPLDLANWLENACLWEAHAPKAGNVHPDASFEDMTYNDFVRASRIVGFMLSRIGQRTVGDSILSAASAIKLQVGKNTSLGTLLLLAPLTAAAIRGPIDAHINSVIDELDVQESRKIVQAIRETNPGGLGNAPEQDVSEEPTCPPRELMALAADRDLIARQYANGFEDLLNFGEQVRTRWQSRNHLSLDQQIVGMQLEWMASYPDSHIERKCGAEIAEDARQRATSILAAGWPENPESLADWNELDSWLREEGHRKNPGTIADLIAASLFIGMVQEFQAKN